MLFEGKKLRLAFCGSSPEAAEYLQFLGVREIAILKVFTSAGVATVRGEHVQRNAVIQAAERLDIPCSSAPIDGAECAALRAAGCDLLLTVDYGKILPAEVLAVPAMGTINVHPSLLPKYRGPSPIETALLDGASETGVSFMLTNDSVDGGPVLFQTPPFKVDPRARRGSLKTELFRLGLEHLMAVIGDYLAGDLRALEQDEAAATYTRLIAKVDGRIDFSRSAAEIDRMVRAYDGWPSAHTNFGDKQLKLLDVELADAADLAPGEAAARGGELFIGTADGSLRVVKAQVAGSKSQTGRDFINGYPAISGYTFV